MVACVLRRLQESFVSLQGLLFSCKYKVVLQPVSRKSQSLSESTSFFTPSCASIQAKSPKPISCPGDTGEVIHDEKLKSPWIILKTVLPTLSSSSSSSAPSQSPPEGSQPHRLLRGAGGKRDGRLQLGGVGS